MSTPTIYSGARGGGKSNKEAASAAYPPVERYAAALTRLKGVKHHVMSIPKGSAAYQLGYRYVSVPAGELAYYQSKGAQLVEQAP